MRAWVMTVAAALVLASCGGSDDSKAVPPTAPAVTVAPTSEPASSAPTAASAPTEAPTTSTGSTGSTTVVPSTAPVTAPVANTDLVDGKVYWGYVAGFKAGPPATFAIDVSEVYFGQQAIAEATKDHAEGTIEPDVDPVMYVRNNNTKTRLLAVRPGVKAVLDGCDYGEGSKTGDVGGDCRLAKTVPLSAVPVADGEDAGALVIFVLAGGQISRIEQPYFP